MNQTKQFFWKPMTVFGLLGLALCLLLSACRQSPASKAESTPSASLPGLPTADETVPANESGLKPAPSEQAVAKATTQSLGVVTPAIETTPSVSASAAAGTSPSETPITASDGKTIEAAVPATATRLLGATSSLEGQSENTVPPSLPTLGPTELAATAPPPPLEPTPTFDQQDSPPGASGGLTITALEITRDQVTVIGVTTILEESCILTRLTDDEQEVPWWPEELCAEQQGSDWTLIAVLEGDATLDPAAQYVLEAWIADQPASISQPFPWDIGGPPGQ